MTWRELLVARVMDACPGVRHSLIRFSARMCLMPPGCTWIAGREDCSGQGFTLNVCSQFCAGECWHLQPCSQTMQPEKQQHHKSLRLPGSATLEQVVTPFERHDWKVSVVNRTWNLHVTAGYGSASLVLCILRCSSIAPACGSHTQAYLSSWRLCQKWP